MEMKPLSISEVNQYIKQLLVDDWLLSNIIVEGEVSNFVHHYSGHMYFTLKDEKSRIRCVMFKSYNQDLNIDLRDGLKIIVSGYISVYEKDGSYQLYVRDIKNEGIGDLYLAFEQLKARLEREGLFDADNKKEIPSFPNKIGVVTSATGAAIKDIITVIRRRFGLVDILIYPALVQGLQAPEDICAGLTYLDERDDIDIIIVSRGGGSFEELFAFNDETMAYTISRMNTPIISAVGHETDFTIADFVADLRAPTPSAAAELATPRLDNLREELSERCIRMNRIYGSILENSNLRLQHMQRELNLYNPVARLEDKAQRQDELFERLISSMERKLGDNAVELRNNFNRLRHLGPVDILNRGYGVLIDEDSMVISSIDDLNMGRELELLLKDGVVKIKVLSIKEGEFNYG
ncbi:MAG: exodeoxyribonuclease VII large subunit [Tissierellia bacterium]|nr:exodeoxyribonuclease VII large subunit [Tissierellia bacterium]